MNNSKYRWILYTIVLVIMSTIAIQVYWNYKNYESNKQQLINDVQASLDNAVEKYYANLAEQTTIGFAIESTSKGAIFGEDKAFDSILKQLDLKRNTIRGFDSIDINIQSDNIRVFRGLKADSLLQTMHRDHAPNLNRTKDSVEKPSIQLEHFSFETTDSTLADPFENLTSKVIISMSSDSLETKDVDAYFISEITHKNLDIAHQLHFVSPLSKLDSLEQSIKRKGDLFTVSKSPFLPPNNVLYVSFSNATKEILKRILAGILISTLLVLAVISCLFYLLNIIKHQKQLAALKNDLISNITHEFKTPIATIGVALESIKDFNMITDIEKTTSYLDMSRAQLNKLNIMVEKLLETATLDSQNLELNKDSINCVDLVESLLKKHQLTTDKTMGFDTTHNTLMIAVDVFHFENAISNIIDNAIKYGGDIISIRLQNNAKYLQLEIIDNGHTLTPQQKDKIFEKFYRVPKGNTHDVKGFGIGLYYTKTIIEKHGGTIDLELSNTTTTFKITLPHDA